MPLAAALAPRPRLPSLVCQVACSTAAITVALPGLDERTRVRSLLWSVVPSLIAWPALLLVPSDAAVLLVLGFVLHYVQDRRLARVADLPGWYLPLRLRLTAVACIALIAGAFVQWPY